MNENLLRSWKLNLNIFSDRQIDFAVAQSSILPLRQCRTLESYNLHCNYFNLIKLSDDVQDGRDFEDSSINLCIRRAIIYWLPGIVTNFDYGRIKVNVSPKLYYTYIIRGI